MRKRWRRIGVCALVAALTCSMTFPSFANNVQQAEDQLSDLQKEKKQIENKIKDLEKEKGNITSYITKLDGELDDLNGKIESTNTDIAKTEKSLEETREELDTAKVQQNDQYETMKARVKYMYENGSSDYMTMLLKSSSLTDLLNRAEYVNKISKYDQGLYTRYESTRQEIEEKETKLSKDLNKLTTLQDKLKVEKDAVDTLISNKTAEMKKYEEGISVAQADVEKYEENIERQKQLVDDLLEQERKKREEERKRREEEERRKQEELAAQQKPSDNNNTSNKPSTGNGSNQNNSSSFRWPLNVSGRITSYFGNRPSPKPGASSYHKGLDIAAPTGTAILSTADGEVASAGYNSVRGNYVMIDHGNGIYSIYMHCSRINVSVGQQVKKGQVVAAVGSTGVSTGPHLHFSITKNDVYVNPLKYVSQP